MAIRVYAKRGKFRIKRALPKGANKKADKALNQIKVIKNRLNTEYLFGPAVVGANATVAGAITAMPALHFIDRSTTGVKPKAYRLWRWFGELKVHSTNGTSTAQPRSYRVILFRDSEQQRVAPGNPTSVPSVTTLLDTASPLSRFTEENQGRFKIYFDKHVVLSPLGSGGKMAVNYRVNIKLGGMIQEQDDDNTHSAILSNGLYVLFIGEDTMAQLNFLGSIQGSSY